VVDLGAHVGTFCVPAALLGRHLLAVDASQRHVRLIETSRQVNNLKSLSIVHQAIVAEDGPVAFSERGLFGAVDFAHTDRNAVTVHGKTLSALLDEMRFDRIKLIKMDIEGSELPALESIAPRLDENDAPAILYESNEETFHRAGYSVADMRLWLEAHAYHTYRTEGERLVYAAPDQPQPELWVDLLALKPDHEKRFANLIDRNWSAGAMRDRFFSCASLPYANTRSHLIRLLADPAVRSQHEDLAALAAELAGT
jgi:FkbM family methyltransferase